MADTKIARIWRGIVPLERADAYLELMRDVALPDYRKTPGNIGAWVLRRILRDHAEFTMVSHWQSLGSIEAFAGAELTRAKYYDFDRDFLVELAPHVEHHEMYDA